MENELLVLWTGRQIKNDNMKNIITMKLMEHAQPNSTENAFFAYNLIQMKNLDSTFLH